jgi:hypothetical protein
MLLMYLYRIGMSPVRAKETIIRFEKELPSTADETVIS